MDVKEIRREFGGKVEEALNKIIDEKLNAEALLPLLTDLVNKQLEAVKHQIKANMIDLIDGEDDIA